MYGYSFDAETGGLLLNDSVGQTSLEPRPVYAPEMDALEFGDHWNYERQSDVPILWAEAENYTYRGKRIARTKGGKLHEKPALEPLVDKETGRQVLPDGETLLPVDLAAMNEKNAALLLALKQAAETRIHDVYGRYKDKLDGFHVAFSGGKDSIVLLDLVAEALPPSAFVVVFGDTGMEFPDTYALVDKVEADCRARGIAFHRAESRFKPEESWRLFGPPSRVLRWCCSVHKSAPQTIKLREIYGKNDFSGLAFVGVRAEESPTRAGYEVENFGKKQKGQYSHNSIFEWTSAEVWAYLLWRDLPLNVAYKKGMQRVGCLYCPLGAGGKSDFFQYASYKNEMDEFLNLIREKIVTPDIESYISGGGWIARKNGRDIRDNPLTFSEMSEPNGQHRIDVASPKSDVHEWLKTLGALPFQYTLEEKNGSVSILFPEEICKTLIGKRLKSVFHKAAACIGCGVCEGNCRNGRLSFKDGLHITDCLHCGQCHEIDAGCIAFHSLDLPTTNSGMKMSINTFSNHAPKPEWLSEFFREQNRFLEDNTLGRLQISFFRRFLSDAGLTNKNGRVVSISDLGKQIANIGWETNVASGIILSNLAATNAQVRWYLDNMPVGQVFTKAEMVDMLKAQDLKDDSVSSIINSFKRLVELPLGTRLNWGFYYEEGRGNATMGRRECRLLPDDRLAVLYALYLYSEKCENLNQFTLTHLLDDAIVSGGTSPAKLFGLKREALAQFLSGLGEAYPDFLSVTFTHDLEKISLREGKTSADVLALIGR